MKPPSRRKEMATLREATQVYWVTCQEYMGKPHPTKVDVKILVRRTEEVALAAVAAFL